MTTRELLKKPSAFLPLALSAAAVAVLVAAFAHNEVVYHTGLVRQPDEGAAAHLWQLCMGLQLPIVAVFLGKWFPAAPRQALTVFAFQVAGIVAAAGPVFYFRL